MLAIISLFQQYPAFGNIYWGETSLNIKKAKELLRTQTLMENDGSAPTIEITSPSKVAQKPYSFRGTTKKCWICGEVVVSYANTFSCYQCGAFLCEKCHKTGLCQDHFEELSFKQQKDVVICHKDYQIKKTQLERPLKVIVLPTLFINIIVFSSAIGIYSTLKDWVSLSFIIGGFLACVIALLSARVKQNHLRPTFNRAKIVFQAFLDEIPTLSQIRPTCRDNLLVGAREHRSGELSSTRTSSPEASDSPQRGSGDSQGEVQPKIPLLEDDTTFREWKEFVNTKLPSLYCPHCKLEHPTFARYCIFCGKPLPKPS
ncbi:MAG: hypothetical protein RBG13Loki_4027 [Promethearchaeota archaeon CR_4]|nr:MAG: hypothetical protein RBG13Loki_4027 [Candidatus Lokiarchaeota archaeon CR_4]